VTASWNIGGLLRDLALRDRHPAVIAFAVEGSETWDSATVADKALGLACGLRDTGIGTGVRVALWATAPPHEEAAMATDFDRWLAPAGALLTTLALALYGLNRLLMRGLFRLHVSGAAKLPETGAFVITPNHVSDLDGLAIAAALPWSQFRRLYWAGDLVRMFSNPLNRLFCRAISRLSGRCKPSRRGARSRPARAQGGRCAGLVSRGLALSGWNVAAFPAGHRSVAAAQRRPGRPGLYRGRIRGSAARPTGPQSSPNHRGLRPS